MLFFYSKLQGNEINSKDSYLIFLNGIIVGVHPRPNELAKKIRNLRRKGIIGEFVSVYLHETQKTVYLATDGGRVCRPLIIVEDGISKLEKKHIDNLGTSVKLEDLLEMGIIEYIDVNEENNCLVALDEKHISTVPPTTHMEIGFFF